MYQWLVSLLGHSPHARSLQREGLGALREKGGSCEPPPATCHGLNLSRPVLLWASTADHDLGRRWPVFSASINLNQGAEFFGRVRFWVPITVMTVQYSQLQENWTLCSLCRSWRSRSTARGLQAVDLGAESYSESVRKNTGFISALSSPAHREQHSALEALQSY